MSFLLSSLALTPEPDSSGRTGSLGFNHTPEVSQLLLNSFELIGSIPGVKRIELWFINTFPPLSTEDKSYAEKVRLQAPQLWRVKDTTKEPLDLARLSRVEVPIQYKQSLCGMAITYVALESPRDSLERARDLLRLTISGLELGLNLAVRVSQPEAATLAAEEAMAKEVALSTVHEKVMQSLGKYDDMMAALQSEFSRAMRHSLDLVVMLIEVDTYLIREVINTASASAVSQPSAAANSFARYNFPAKAYAENPADEIMKYTAYLATKYLRISDAVYVFDSTHLGVILPHSDEVQAYRAAEKLLKMIDSHSYYGALGLSSSQWAVIGISSFPYLSNNMETLIKHCQQALARAKRSGNTTKPYIANDNAQPSHRQVPPHICIWKATKMLSIHDINEINDRQAIRSVMRGFRFVDLSPYLDQLVDPKRRAKFKPVFDMIPFDLARQHQVVAINYKKQTGSNALTVVMADPGNTVAVSNLVQTTGANVITEVARADQINQLIDLMRD